MPADTFGVSAASVLATLPANTTNVTSTSEGLNTVQVEGFIERAGGQVAAALVRNGIDPTGLGPNEIELARDAVIAYAAAYSLERIGGAQDQITRRLDEWGRLLKLLREQPQNLGAAQDVQSAQKVRSNIDPSARRPEDRRRWNSRNYSGW